MTAIRGTVVTFNGEIGCQIDSTNSYMRLTAKSSTKYVIHQYLSTRDFKLVRKAHFFEDLIAVCFLFGVDFGNRDIF